MACYSRAGAQFCLAERGHLHALLGIPPTDILASHSSLKIKRAAERSACFIARREPRSDTNAVSHFLGQLVDTEWNREVETLWLGNPSLSHAHCTYA